MTTPTVGTGTQSIDRAADLLARVVRAPSPVTFTELAEVTGLARSTTSRLLSALERTLSIIKPDAGPWGT